MLPLTEKKKILILDDEKDICFLLSILLNKMGFITDCAHSLKEGEHKIKQQHFDLAFIDLNLPDGLGYTLARKIKEAHLPTKIVLISAHDALLKKIRDEKEGIDFFIDKPFNKEKINTVLHSIDFV